MTGSTPQVTVRLNDAEGLYEAVADGVVVGTISFEESDGRRIFTHTIVDPAFRGRGVAGQLARGALEDIRATGIALTNQCSYIDDFVDAHPEYQDLL